MHDRGRHAEEIAAGRLRDGTATRADHSKEGTVVKPTGNIDHFICPASCSGQRETSECAWVDDMLQIFGGVLFLGVTRDRLAHHAPCRRAFRAARAAERRDTPGADARVAERTS